MLTRLSSLALHCSRLTFDFISARNGTSLLTGCADMKSAQTKYRLERYPAKVLPFPPLSGDAIHRVHRLYALIVIAQLAH